MTSFLIAVRDFLVLLALSWIGLTFEPQQERHQTAEPPAAASASACAQGGVCESRRPSFDAETCG